MIAMLSDCLRAIWMIIGCLVGIMIIVAFIKATIDEFRGE